MLEYTKQLFLLLGALPHNSGINSSCKVGIYKSMSYEQWAQLQIAAIVEYFGLGENDEN